MDINEYRSLKAQKDYEEEMRFQLENECSQLKNGQVFDKIFKPLPGLIKEVEDA